MVWFIELFGGLRARRDGQVLASFPKQSVAKLLAYLAYHHARPVTRTALIEILWPEAVQGGEHRQTRDPPRDLRNALSLLRRLLHSPGAEHSPILETDHHSV